MFDETPKVDFTVKDDDGNVVFRDSLVFSSMQELRNVSQEEREAMMQQRYDNWLQALEDAQNAPVEEPTDEESELQEEA